MSEQKSTAQAKLPETLASGYRSFKSHRLPNERDRFAALARDGQKPSVLLIGCSDSRVAPESIFDAGPGEIFVIRNVANLVPPYSAATADGAASETAAAIEYAVVALKVAHIVVMGHEQCGGIRAYASDQKRQFNALTDANFVGRWKALVAPAAEAVGSPPDEGFDQHCEHLAHASVKQGLANLRTYPFIREREADGSLKLHGAFFGTKDGSMQVLDSTSGRFVDASN